jgi:hypothetical protein
MVNKLMPFLNINTIDTDKIMPDKKSSVPKTNWKFSDVHIIMGFTKVSAGRNFL